MCNDLRVRAGSGNWRRARAQGIGASEIAMALGIAPPTWGGPTTLYYRKRGELPDDFDNARMEWGRRLENTILERFFECHPELDGKRRTGRLYQSKERPWQLATPDAVVMDTRHGFTYDKHPGAPRTAWGVPTVVQAKTGSKTEGWGEPGTDEIPVYYRAQVLQEMDVVGARVAWVPVLFNGSDYREYVVERDQGDIDILRARGAEFWQRVVDGRPPTVDSLLATKRALNEAFRVEPDKFVQVEPSLVEKYWRAKAVADRAEALRQRYENELRALMADASAAMAGLELAATRTTYTQRAFDLARFREENPELAAKYETKEPRTRLHIKKKRGK